MIQDDILELEMDELNQHECMATMTALIKHMQRNQILPKGEEVFFFLLMLFIGIILRTNISYQRLNKIPCQISMILLIMFYFVNVVSYQNMELFYSTFKGNFECIISGFSAKKSSSLDEISS